MASLNKCCFIGNCGKDPESRQTASGTSVASVSIAVTEKYKDKETTEWIPVTFWGKLADVVTGWVFSGSQIYVEGRWTTERWTDKEGNERTSVKVTAEKLVMLGGKGGKVGKGSSGQSQGGGGDRYESPDFDSDSIPF